MKKSDTFCILPFIHQEVQQNGKVMLCCQAQDSAPLGNLESQTPIELWNCDSIRKSRVDLRNGVWPKDCGSCKRDESDGLFSMRKLSNEKFKEHLSDADQMHPNGEMPDFNLRFIGIRHSNFCNLRCIYCDHNYSTSWGFDPITKKVQTPFPGGNQGLLNYVKEHKDRLEEIYIAGGEPLIDFRHLELLQMLIANDSTNLRLIYNSNLTSLKIKGVDLIPLWKSFKQVSISASIDDFGERFEKIRVGAKWDNIARNIQTLMDHRIDLEIFVTVTIKNYPYLLEFITHLEKEFNLPNHRIVLNVLHSPRELSIKNMDKKEKREIDKEIKIFLKKIIINNKEGSPLPYLYSELSSIIKIL